MVLHWVEQAAIEAQAALAQQADQDLLDGAAPVRSFTSRSVGAAEWSRAAPVAARGTNAQNDGLLEEEMVWPTCERAWSHSDELDQVCAAIRDGMQSGLGSEALAASLRETFAAGALCWGRCVSYCCARRKQRNLLMECARSGAVAAIWALLGQGVPPVLPDPLSSAALDLRIERGGYSALHYAAYGGHAAAVHALLHAGADAQIANSLGETPEQSAVAGGHPHVASVLAAWTAATTQAATSRSSSSSSSGSSISSCGAEGRSRDGHVSEGNCEGNGHVSVEAATSCGDNSTAVQPPQEQKGKEQQEQKEQKEQQGGASSPTATLSAQRISLFQRLHRFRRHCRIRQTDIQPGQHFDSRKWRLVKMRREEMALESSMTATYI